MELLYHGHSCIQITEGEHSLIIDPFISGNPNAVTKPEDVNVQYVLLTHGHSDHILDALPIAKANGASIVATFELASYMGWEGAKTIPMNLGGTHKTEFGSVKMIQAFHSSAVLDEGSKAITYLGMPGGFIVSIGGKTLLHCGDTGLFGDMKMYGELYDIDCAFIPIGDQLTMGPEDAAIAAEWLKAKLVVPIHYNTFPMLVQDGGSFEQMLEKKNIRGQALKPGESLTL